MTLNFFCFTNYCKALKSCADLEIVKECSTEIAEVLWPEQRWHFKRVCLQAQC